MVLHKKFSFLCLIICTLFVFKGGISAEVGDAEESPAFKRSEETDVFGNDKTYGSYVNKYADYPCPDKTYIIPGKSYSSMNDADIKILDEFKGEEGVLEWTGETGWIEWGIEIPEAGLYNLAMKYFPVEGKGRDIEFELELDGEIPFEGAMKLQFNRVWQDGSEIKRDNRDNELRPRQVEEPVWMEQDFRDTEGLYGDSYKFFLNKGKHTIRLISTREPIIIKHLKIYRNETLPEYNLLKKEYANKNYKPADKTIKIQAEDTYQKSHPVIHSVSDKSSPLTEPYHPTKIRMNTIGGENWKYPSQWVTWEIDIEEDGLYKIGMRYRQNALRGFYTTRKFYIDGKIPFKEMERVEFPYGISWQLKVLGDGEPYEFYLAKGTHKITMEVTLGNIAETLRIVQDSVYKLNYMYRKIVMITSVQPDTYRDYYLDREIPDLMPTFDEIEEILRNEALRLEMITKHKGTEAILLLRIADQLESFIKEPDTIPARLNKYKDNISALAAWILKIKEQPLELDYIVVQPPKKDFQRVTANVFEKALHEIKAFAGSFFEDYTSVGNTFDDRGSIDVWIGTGRDQAQILKAMIDDRFTPESGITVNLSLVQGALLQATMAGKGPDVALTVGRGEPVNLALRGALVALNQFNEFDEIIERFMPEATIPYMLGDNCYALPETQTFFMMFYRKDVFEELGIEPPQTWNDLYDIAPVIQMNNMQIGLPYIQLDAYSLIGMGMGAQSIFPTLIMQNGGKIYNEGHTGTELGTQIAYRAFKQWTDFYNLYGFPLFKDDYSRFRTGEMPITINAYSFYNMLAVAAPEIRNLWEMAPVPGVRMDNGKINRTVCAAGAASIILSTAKNTDASWEFVKWWTSAEIQARFGNEVEALMGPAGRYTPANTEAFKDIPWSYKEQELLMEQWGNVKEIPEVPGGYYTQRNIDNALRAVIFRWENPRESLNYWNNKTNEEITRKRLEFGLNEK